MHNFYIWFSTGFSHIINLEAYDHILFLIALCCIYTWEQWKKMLLVITAFTIGHSLTLVLSALQVFIVNLPLVEFLIAITILLTCLYNLRVGTAANQTSRSCWIASLFGLIHGLGFAGTLKQMLFDNNILLPLFSFNIGLEAGQLLVVILLLIVLQLVRSIFRLQQRSLNIAISATVGCIAVVVAISRFTDIFHH